MDMLPDNLDGFELLPEEGEMQQLEAEIFADGTDAFDQLEADDVDVNAHEDAEEPHPSSDELAETTDAEEAVAKVLSRTRNLGDELDDDRGALSGDDWCPAPLEGLEFDAEEGLIRPEMDHEVSYILQHRNDTLVKP